MNRILSLIILVLAEAAFCLVLVKMYRDSYINNLRLRSDPLEESQLTKVPDVCDIMAIGSSSIKRWPFDSLKSIRTAICNLGIDGQTSKQVLMRVEDQVQKYCPKLLIVQVGVNDIKSIKFVKDKQLVKDQYIENVKKIFALCSRKNISVLYVNNFPAGRRTILRAFVWDKGLDKIIYETNDYFRDFCSENNIFYFDAYKLIVRDKSYRRRPEFTLNFFHLNQKGYNVLNKNLEPILINIIERL
jgi:lysophospholipase L1-like esterase